MILTKNSFKGTVNKKSIALLPWKFLKTKVYTELSCSITNDRQHNFPRLIMSTVYMNVCVCMYINASSPYLASLIG